MEVRIASTVQDIESLRPLVKAWKESCSCDKFGLEADVNILLVDVLELVANESSALLLLQDGDEIIGLMGLVKFKSPFGTEYVANEHYMYIQEGRGSMGSVRFIKAAEDWARSHGCSHLMMNASNAASELHDKVCKLYERRDMLKFETSYIKEII